MSQQCGSDSNALYTSARLHSTTLADQPLHGLAALVPKNLISNRTIELFRMAHFFHKCL